jgi:hypothetical protein
MSITAPSEARHKCEDGSAKTKSIELAELFEELVNIERGPNDARK